MEFYRQDLKMDISCLFQSCGFQSTGNEVRIFKARLAVGHGRIVQFSHTATGCNEDGVTRGDVPFHGSSQARINIGCAGGDKAKFQGTASAGRTFDVQPGNVVFQFRRAMIAAGDDNHSIFIGLATGYRARVLAFMFAEGTTATAPVRIAQGRGVNHAKNRQSRFDEGDIDGEFIIFLNKAFGAVQCVYKPEWA